jgi:hypothetical protein
MVPAASAEASLLLRVVHAPKIVPTKQLSKLSVRAQDRLIHDQDLNDVDARHSRNDLTLVSIHYSPLSSWYSAVALHSILTARLSSSL